MSLMHDAAVGMGRVLSSVHSGEHKLASRKLGLSLTSRLNVESPDFKDGERLPLSATIEGAAQPPELTWYGIPKNTQSLVIICEDPDAPFPEPFAHWLAYDLSPKATTVEPERHEGRSSKLNIGYSPAAPPPGHGTHHYHFQVFALDVVSSLPRGAGRGALLGAMRGHVLAWGEIVGTYERE